MSRKTDRVEAHRPATCAAVEAGDAPRSGLRISFKNSRDQRLAGDLLVPDGTGPHPAVIFAHGRGSEASPRDRVIAEALCAAGLAAFLLDFTGLGDSQGSEADDLRAALDVLAMLDEIDARRLGVVGAGAGAVAARRLAAVDLRIRALAVRAADISGAEAAAGGAQAPTLLVDGENDAAAPASTATRIVRWMKHHLK